MNKTTRRMARQPAQQQTEVPPIADEAPTPAKEAKASSKIASVIALLQRDEGATLSEIETATGWQTHTIRASLTRLRKKGHVVEKTKRDDATCYRIAKSS